MKKIFKVFLVLLFLVGFASYSIAQRQTGAIAGKVVDSQGTPLPGASLTLSGPSMLGTLSYSSTESGEFRFPSVQPGRDYMITVEMSGFQKTIRSGLIVSVGRTIRVIIELKQATLEEAVTVTGAAPVLDVTSTKEGVVYTSELLANIPFERDYYSIIESAPGVVSEDASYRRTFGVTGTGIRDNEVAIEGVSITDTTVRTNKIGFSFDIFEEVELELGAHAAEVGQAPGAYVNIITKSGGNDYHGSVLANYYNKDMVASLIPVEETQARGLTAPTGLYSNMDFSGSLGGRIIKDRLWFFGNIRYLNYKAAAETIVNGRFIVPHSEVNAFGKLTYQLNPKIKLVGLLSYRGWDEEFAFSNRLPSYWSDKYTSYNIDNSTNYVALLMANWTMNQNSFLDFRFQYNSKFEPFHLHPDLNPTIPSYYDLNTGISSGQPGWLMYDFLVERYQAKASISQFLDGFLGGNHEIKAGIEYDMSPSNVDFWKGIPITLQYTYDGSPWGLQDAQPYLGMFEADTGGEKKGDWHLHLQTRRFGAYFQDSFNLKNRITLNLGLRYDEQRGDVIGGPFKPVGAKSPVLKTIAPNEFSDFTLPDYKNLLVWKDLQPRLGLVFDVFGDQTTSLKASWSRYTEFQTQGYIIYLTPAHPQYLEALWLDLNKDGIMDTTDEYTVTVMPVDPFAYIANPEQMRNDLIDPNFKSPYVDETIIGLSRELFKGFSVSVSYIHKQKKRIVENVEKFRGYKADSGWWVPFTVSDPGWDGKFGTSDDKQITAYGVKKGAPPSRVWQTNPPEVVRKYNGVEFLFTKRMSAGWQLLGSLVLGKAEGNRIDDYAQSEGLGNAFDTPNWLINRYGRDIFDRPVILKLQSSVMLPYDFMLSASYSYMSGAPWGRTVKIQIPNDPNTYEYAGTFVSETIMAESPGTRRYHSRNNLDIRIEKILSIRGFGRFGVFLDVQNLLGETGYEISQDPGGRIFNNGSFVRWPNYGKFTGVYGLRTYRVSARFTF